MENWPALPLNRPYLKNTNYFRFGNKSPYTDIPIGSIANLYQEIVEKCDGEPSLEKAKKCADKILKETNRNIINNFNELAGTSDNSYTTWLKIIVKRMTNSHKPLHVSYHIDWKSFNTFLTKMASSNVSIEKKYKYILACKLSGEDLAADTIQYLIEKKYETSEDSLAIYLRKFSEVVSPYKSGSVSLLKTLYGKTLTDLKTMQKLYRTSSLTKFLPDLLQTIKTLIGLIETGRISTFYRECRSLVERLSWATMDDFLVTNSIVNNMGKWNEAPSVFLNISEEWFQNKRGIPQIRSLEDLNEETKRRTGEKLDMNGSDKFILKHMSYETYLTLTGHEKKGKISDYVPVYANGSLIDGITQLKVQFSNVFSSQKSDKMLNTLKDKLSTFNGVIPRYPTTKFVLQFLEAVSDGEITLLYFWDNYSLFIHPYLYTWQLIPETSVLEYYILSNEVVKLTEAVSRLVDFEIEHVNTAYKEYRQ
jgi:translation initiation factor 2 beta subunit (eIF-2beta)/eIF-5